MFGESGGKFTCEGFELAPVNAANEGGLVDQRAKLVCGGKQRGGRQALAIDIDAPCLDKTREGAATLGGRERWRQIERVGTERGETILLLNVAERADLGREHRAVHGVVE